MATLRKAYSIFALLFYSSNHQLMAATGRETQVAEQRDSNYTTTEAPSLGTADQSAVGVVIDQQTSVVEEIDNQTVEFNLTRDNLSVDEQEFGSDATPEFTKLIQPDCTTSCALDCFGSNLRSCSCHSYCYLFNDCCDNVSQTNSSSANSGVALPQTAYSCHLYAKNKELSVITILSCPPSYENGFIAQSCMKARNLFNGSKTLDSWSTPVTDSNTGVTYGNIFCALCWGVSKQATVSWLWKFECDDSTSDAQQLLNITKYTSRDSSLAALTYLRKSCTFKFVPPESLSTELTKCIPNEISDCSATSDPKDNLTVLCRSGPAGRVYYNNKTYRNKHCLACNEDGTEFHYFSSRHDIQSSIRFGGSNPSLSFTILVSPSAESCTVLNRDSRSNSIDVNALCRSFATCVAQSGQELQCPEVCPLGLVYEQGGCRAPNATSPCTFADVIDESAVAQSYWSYFASDILIVQLNATSTMCYSCVFTSFTNYTFLANASVVVHSNGTSTVYSRQLYYVQNSSVNVCNSNRNVSAIKRSGTASVGCTSLPESVTIVLLTLSECCLLVYLALCVAAEPLRRFPGEMVLSESISFFLGFAFFLFRRLAGDSSSACKALAVLVHYFLLAAFVWTTLYALEVTRALSSSPVMSGARNRRRVRRIAYHAIGWCLPLLPVLLGIVADDVGLQFQPAYGLPQCFIGSRLGHVALFVGPLCACLTIDVALYGYLVVRLAMLERQTRRARDRRREKLLLCAKLLVALGVLWALAAAASFSDAEALQCAFTVVDSLQGMFVLLIFGIRRNVIATPPRRLATSGRHTAASISTVVGSRALSSSDLIRACDTSSSVISSSQQNSNSSAYH